MDKNKIIILALIVVIAALLVGMAAMILPNMNKQDTKLTFKTNSTITEGGSLKIKLTDANGTAIANQTVNITITDKDGSNSYYSVVTNQNGTGKLEIDKSPGKYNVTITYGGNNNYKGCNATKKITIEEVKVTSASSSSQSSELPYSLYNLPPSNDPYPETNRYQIDEYTVVQEYEDNYRSYVDLRTGQRHGGFF